MAQSRALSGQQPAAECATAGKCSLMLRAKQDTAMNLSWIKYVYSTGITKSSGAAKGFFNYNFFLECVKKLHIFGLKGEICCCFFLSLLL